MAIITEEDQDEQAQPKQPSKPRESQSSSQSSSKAFAFWFYFTLTVSLIVPLFVSFNSLSPRDPKSWFLSLPSNLRQHYSKGRTFKVQTYRDQSPFEVFTFENGLSAKSVSENVLILHGLGLSSYSFREIVRFLGDRSVRTVSIDLPGHGFSDKSVMEPGGRSDFGVLGRLFDVYDEIQEKGLFSAFDRIVETGQMPYEEIEARMSQRKVLRPIEFGPIEMGRVLGQVIESMNLAPLHLVLHDSALGMFANWISENSKALRSVTLIDTAQRSLPVFPLWALETPVIRELVLGSSTAHSWLVKKCCSRGISALDLHAHRALLMSRDARRSVVGIGKNLNSTFDIGKWGGSDELKGVPIQVLWSKSWSKEWSEEGDKVAKALPQASFSLHSGGRWPQENSADEIAQSIFRLVSSLPATIRTTVEEPIPEHIQRKLDEAKNNPHHHHHHHHHDGHDHDSHGHEAGFMDPYGLGHGHRW